MIRKTIVSATLFLTVVMSAQEKVIDRLKKDRVDTVKLNKEGIELGKEGKYSDALRKFSKASSQQDYDAAVTYNNIGYTYQTAGERLKAIDAYNRAVDRDPGLLPALKNLGKLYYKGGQYNLAIKHGEAALKVHPRDRDVSGWLPDAYKKRAEKRILLLDKRSSLPRGEDPRLDHRPEDERYTLELGYTITAPVKYFKSRDLLAFDTYQSLLKVPMQFNVNYWPANYMKIEFQGGLPFWGPINPAILEGEESINFIYQGEKKFIGLGVMFTQANFSVDSTPGGDPVDYRQNSDYTFASDSKLGILFGVKSAAAKYNIYFFPRYLFKDNTTSAARQIQFDRVRLGFEFESSLINLDSKGNWPLVIDFGFRVEEVYITEYSVPSSNETIGHYFGYYDISLGFELGKVRPSASGFPISFGIVFTERLYMQDIANTDLNSFGNGQGYFSIKSSDALAGNPFSGIKSNSHIVGLYSRQLIHRNTGKWRDIFLKESIAGELTLPGWPIHMLYAELSIAIRF